MQMNTCTEHKADPSLENFVVKRLPFIMKTSKSFSVLCLAKES